MATKLGVVKAVFSGLSVVAAAWLGGCQHTTSETVQGPIEVVRPVYDAEDAIWLLYHLNGKPVEVVPSPAALRLYGPTLRAYGTSGVNKFSGEYRIEASNLSFKPLLWETKHAGTPGQMALEQELMATLGRVTNWRVQDKVLVLLEGPKPVAYLLRQTEPPVAK